MTSIYQIDTEIQKLLESLPDTGELTVEDAEALEALQLSRKVKQQNIIRYYKFLNSQVEIINSEIARLSELKALAAKRAEKMVKLLQMSMAQENANELDFVTDKAKFKKNPPRVEIYDESKLDRFVVTKEIKSIDKKALKEELIEKGEVEGAVLVASMRLEIK